MSTQITTGKVRFSYCNLFTPRAAQEGATPKYSVTLLIPKSDKATIQKIKAAMDEAKSKFIASNSGKKLPTNLKNTLHDGDGERPNGGEFGEECKGCYVITVASPIILSCSPHLGQLIIKSSYSLYVLGLFEHS